MQAITAMSDGHVTKMNEITLEDLPNFTKGYDKILFTKIPELTLEIKKTYLTDLNSGVFSLHSAEDEYTVSAGELVLGTGLSGKSVLTLIAALAQL